MHAVKKSLTGRIVFDIILLALETVARVAQPVVQLIRNQQVACSSHVTSSIYKIPLNILFSGIFLFLQIRFSYNTEIALLPYAAYTRFNIYKWSAFIFGSPFLLYHDKFFFGGVVLKILIVRYIINSKMNRNFFIRKAVIK